MERETLVGDLIAHWSERLRIDDMDIRYCPDPPKANRGESSHWPEKNAAAICISRDAPDDVVENIVVHELLHCAMQQMVATYQRASAEFGPQARDESDARWEMAEEQFIERLTVALTGKRLKVWASGEANPHIVKAFS